MTKQEKLQDPIGHRLFKLVEDSEYMMAQQMLYIAKNYNYFGQMDRYMKQFAKIVTELPNKKMAERLENLLNKEIVIV